MDRQSKSNSDNKNQSSSSNEMETNKQKKKKNNGNQNQGSNNNSTPNNKAGTSATSATKEDLIGKLDKNGKPTAAEKQHHRDHDLCLWCGAAGHIATAFPLAAKARMPKAEKPATKQKKA